MQFVKLRLSGFKSFVEPTELVIEPGLTGIVGPNGCGKSNLVEGLRWVMGESSARNMRGADMDDVIFNGSAHRPAKSLAEVLLSLDNQDRCAPAPFNKSDDIEIRRQIERGAGSTYRINGGEVRARDVQLLFADSATGARSTGIVSQGKISRFIEAKPAARRTLIEEAAGITGLHSRRHEAELRLGNAEHNLERLQDVLTNLAHQLQGLERQARQAIRYRNIGEKIRQTERMILARNRQNTQKEHQNALDNLKTYQQHIVDHTATLAQITTRQTAIAADLPALREDKLAANASLQRVQVERDHLTSQEQQFATDRKEWEARLSQIEEDMARESHHDAQATSVLGQLDKEEATLTQNTADQESRLTQARTQWTQLRDKLAQQEAEMDQSTRNMAEKTARQETLKERLQANEQRLGVIALEERAFENDALNEDSSPAVDIAALETEIQEAHLRLEQKKKAASQQEQHTQTMRETLDKYRQETVQKAAEFSQIEAEKKALFSLLKDWLDKETPSIGSMMTVKPGHEAAMAAILGESFTASLDDQESTGWRNLPPLNDFPAFPEGICPLGDIVIESPQALHRRLALSGLAQTSDQARQLQDQLDPGQCLVTLEGCLWRWDGYAVEQASETPATRRLRQRRRLEELATAADESARALSQAETRFQTAQSEAETAHQAEKTAQEALHQAYEALETAQQRRAEFVATAMEQKNKTEKRQAEMAAFKQEAAKLRAETALLQPEWQALKADETHQQMVSHQRNALATQRRLVMEAQRDCDHLQNEIDSGNKRLAAIKTEREVWERRRQDSRSQINRLTERQTTAGRKIATLVQKPGDLEAEKERIARQIPEMTKRQQAADQKLEEAEDALTRIDIRLKQEQDSLQKARENHLRWEIEAQHAASALGTLDSLIRDQFHCEPERFHEEVSSGEDSLETLEAHLKRLIQQRDHMGPVNLQAEEDEKEIRGQLEALEEEKEDLLAAISRLRSGIATLNKEGRHRFMQAFETVDGHFQELFVRLFGGGKAYIKLIDAEDPLTAGLEIYARPPGKTLQTLTLLSGGEQTLTAIALLFAVFLTNPAPICVLDEVDAPLDDANVDRFCDLIEDISSATSTRFLIITHHRLTMARTHQLYGVTMQERGVSQIVAVNMQQAETSARRG